MNDISDEDRKLFRDAIGKVQPVKNDNVQSKIKKPAQTRTKKINDKHSDPPRFPSPHVPTDTPAMTLGAADPLSFSRPNIPPKRLRQLKRGEMKIQSELDLHGLTTGQAQKEILTFIHESQELGYQCVCIIHGKGRSNAPPVLKNYTNRFLRELPVVLAFYSAPPRHGGTGAILVLLKRS